MEQEFAIAIGKDNRVYLFVLNSMCDGIIYPERGVVIVDFNELHKHRIDFTIQKIDTSDIYNFLPIDNELYQSVISSLMIHSDDVIDKVKMFNPQLYKQIGKYDKEKEKDYDKKKEYIYVIIKERRCDACNIDVSLPLFSSKSKELTVSALKELVNEFNKVHPESGYTVKEHTDEKYIAYNDDDYIRFELTKVKFK